MFLLFLVFVLLLVYSVKHFGMFLGMKYATVYKLISLALLLTVCIFCPYVA